MGAHNSSTEHYARRRAEYAANILDSIPESKDNGVGEYWARSIREGLEARTGGTLRAWIQDHDGDAVDTLQVDILLDQAEPAGLVNGWAPGARRISAERKTYALLGGSRRDYAGVTTLVATDRVYIGFTESTRNPKAAVTMITYVA